MNTIRGFLNPGGFAAVLACLFVLACGNPPGMDSGHSDAGPPPGDTGPDITPDAYVPPDVDAGMPVDTGVMDDAGTGMECTPTMMEARISPPCEPDLPVGLTPDNASMPAACRTTLDGDRWAGTLDCSGGGSTYFLDPSPMGLIEIYIGCATGIPFEGIYHYGRDNVFYANWKNAGLVGEAGNHARLTVNPACTGATVEVFYGGNLTDTPDQTFDVYLM